MQFKIENWKPFSMKIEDLFKNLQLKITRLFGGIVMKIIESLWNIKLKLKFIFEELML